MDSIVSSSTISSQELNVMIEDLPDTDITAIQANPKMFVELAYEVLSQAPELVWIVDKEHAVPEEYEPADLVDLEAHDDRLVLGRAGLRVRAIIIPDLLSMVDEAAAQSIELKISSTYRSFAYQSTVYQRWVAELGQEEADRTSARPGRSQHQLGTTIDFGCICDEFADEDAGMWMAENAWLYGFSMSYPQGKESETGYSYESWHFRYIGKPAARLQQYYFSGMQHLMLNFIESHREMLINARR